MTESDALAERFEEHRTRLRAIARRILGSPSDADDAVQEAWLRFRRSDTSAIHHLESWLTTVVSRVCLNMLQSRTSQPQPLPDSDLPEGSRIRLNRTLNTRRSSPTRSGSRC
jgi:DNA-directed RNA polymerase specialized sigma24 family protein